MRFQPQGFEGSDDQPILIQKMGEALGPPLLFGSAEAWNFVFNNPQADPPLESHVRHANTIPCSY